MVKFVFIWSIHFSDIDRENKSHSLTMFSFSYVLRETRASNEYSLESSDYRGSKIEYDWSVSSMIQKNEVYSAQPRLDNRFKLWNVAIADFSMMVMMTCLLCCFLGIGSFVRRGNESSFAFQVKQTSVWSSDLEINLQSSLWPLDISTGKEKNTKSSQRKIFFSY